MRDLDYPEEYPAPDELADEHDEAGWDRDRHGTFAEHAADDGAVRTTERDPDGVYTPSREG